jgi:group I intron endonuclease
MQIGEIRIQEHSYKNSCVYSIKNLSSGKVYIGSTINYKKRANEHRNDLKLGIHHNKHLQRSFNKGNHFELSILEKIEGTSLIERECHFCSEYNSYDKNHGYNMVEPMQLPHHKISPELRVKMVAGLRKRGWDLSYLRTPEEIRKQAEGKFKKVLIYKRDGSFIGEAISLIQAEELTGAKRQNISAVCRGVKPTARDYIFKFSSQIDKNSTRKN